LRLAFTGLVLFYSLAGLFLSIMNPIPKIEITDRSLGEDRPFGAVEFMSANRLQGNIFAPLWWGSYLTWELYPAILVSMDGRNDTLYPVEMVGENLEFFRGLAGTDTPLKYDTDYLLIPAASPIMAEIRADPRWSVLYEDTGSTLLVQTGSECYDPLRDYQQVPSQPSFIQAHRYFP
jgi:hypothetical protein